MLLKDSTVHATETDIDTVTNTAFFIAVLTKIILPPTTAHRYSASQCQIRLLYNIFNSDTVVQH